MLVTKDMMARAIAEKSGYFLKDIRDVLSAMDEVVLECFAQVTDDEEVMILCYLKNHLISNCIIF